MSIGGRAVSGARAACVSERVSLMGMSGASAGRQRAISRLAGEHQRTRMSIMSISGWADEQAHSRGAGVCVGWRRGCGAL